MNLSCTRSSCPAYDENFKQNFDRRSSTTENFYDAKEPEHEQKPLREQFVQKPEPQLQEPQIQEPRPAESGNIFALNINELLQQQQILVHLLQQGQQQQPSTSRPTFTQGVPNLDKMFEYMNFGKVQGCGPFCDCNNKSTSLSPSLLNLLLSNTEESENFRSRLKTLLSMTENLLYLIQQDGGMSNTSLIPGVQNDLFDHRLHNTFGPQYPSPNVTNIPQSNQIFQNEKPSAAQGTSNFPDKMNIELPLFVSMTVTKDPNGETKVLSNSLEVKYNDCKRNEENSPNIQSTQGQEIKNENQGDKIDHNRDSQFENRKSESHHSREAAGVNETMSRSTTKPLPKPQQRDIELCAPCTCTKDCPIYTNDDEEPVCPEGCGCCDCPYVLVQKIRNQQKIIKNCTCESSIPQPCTCDLKIEACKCIQIAQDYQKKEKENLSDLWGPRSSQSKPEHERSKLDRDQRSSMSDQQKHEEDEKISKISSKYDYKDESRSNIESIESSLSSSVTHYICSIVFYIFITAFIVLILIVLFRYFSASKSESAFDECNIEVNPSK